VGDRPRLFAAARYAAAFALTVGAGAALVTVATARSNGPQVSAAYYYYCPPGSGSSSSVYYCPPPNEPPDCSAVEATPDVLWPPNHKLVLVTLGGATDPEGEPVTIAITGVTQDEPVNGQGDGDTAPDAAPGSSPNSVLLRAERSGGGDGRVYRIAFTASDGAGGTCSGVVTVGVPHDKKSTPVDSAPPSFNSFGP
jgi:hypothetical protein